MIDFLIIVNYYYYNEVNYIVGNMMIINILILRSIICQLFIWEGIID